MAAYVTGMVDGRVLEVVRGNAEPVSRPPSDGAVRPPAAHRMLIMRQTYLSLLVNFTPDSSDVDNSDPLEGQGVMRAERS